ncbi:alpha/beta hydrolase family protein [Pseudooceanicola nanhaiensis]|uniref:alpha/beta hydrolase family protein n=1 Tax=Pseudooceanicola nanhaiensis TaxID=375761 RepID=UPI001CD6B674|nr:alpha/beta hydrolase [Pseudooceanicola nanhaiensis]MCA0921421.1 alpha/beta hydrolase [Pseudooceanicola nanhaiensis]
MSPTQQTTRTEDPASRGTALYDYGSTTVFTYAADPRLVYCLYVPPATVVGPETRIVVVVHGTDRPFMSYRDWFAEFGRWNNCIILAPLFPVGVFGDGNRDGYKYMVEQGLRYDLAVLGMVEEVAAKYGVSSETVGMWGYSGGGHFCNRFLLLHPDRLWAVSIGAPGSVTLIDDSRDFWVGTRDMEERFGIAVDRAAIAKVPVSIIVGKADVETWEITHRPGSRNWMEGANDAGATRPERAQTLAQNLRDAGAEVRLDIVPNMSHAALKGAPFAMEFFAEVLTSLRAAKPGDVVSLSGAR